MLQGPPTLSSLCTVNVRGISEILGAGGEYLLVWKSDVDASLMAIRAVILRCLVVWRESSNFRSHNLVTGA